MAQKTRYYKQDGTEYSFSKQPEIKIMQTSNADTNIGIPKKFTAVEWLEDNLIGNPHFEEDFRHNRKIFEQSKQIEKQQMIDFAEFVATHPDKNKNYLGEMLHAKSKYDGSERTIDLLEQYYNETYNKKENDV